MNTNLSKVEASFFNTSDIEPQKEQRFHISRLVITLIWV
ncbi:hypothetical protein Ct9H90mP29_02940 [bacterium]|nr:MAG: hypothetical protein Ct9H90mP29_02940 [bacterium]